MFQVDRISYLLDIFKQNLWSDFNSDENTYNDMYKEHRFNTGNYYNFHYSVFVHNYLYTYISVLNVSCTTVMNRFSFFQLVFTRVFHRPDNAIQLPLQWCLAYPLENKTASTHTTWWYRIRIVINMQRIPRPQSNRVEAYNFYIIYKRRKRFISITFRKVLYKHKRKKINKLSRFFFSNQFFAFYWPPDNTWYNDEDDIRALKLHAILVARTTSRLETILFLQGLSNCALGIYIIIIILTRSE